MLSVASYTDAWIEMPFSMGGRFSSESHPTRMRGLKFLKPNPMLPFRFVASYTDAWIEIKVEQRVYWVVGVASYTDAWIEIAEIEKRDQDGQEVASYTDAWIEITTSTTAMPLPRKVASYTDAWIEMQPVQRGILRLRGRILHGCVD